MLEVRNLASGYGGHQILWDVSLRVDDGEIVALLGPNGSGKSTLINSISRLVDRLSGDILFDGVALHDLPPHRMLGCGLSHVLERHRLFPYTSVLENLQLGAGPGASREKVERGLGRAYQLFPRLRERVGQMAGSLSGGEQQMCAIARGLMAQPRLLLVDEPFIGLSPHMRYGSCRSDQADQRRGGGHPDDRAERRRGLGHEQPCLRAARGAGGPVRRFGRPCQGRPPAAGVSGGAGRGRERPAVMAESNVSGGCGRLRAERQARPRYRIYKKWF